MCGTGRRVLDTWASARAGKQGDFQGQNTSCDRATLKCGASESRMGSACPVRSSIRNCPQHAHCSTAGWRPLSKVSLGGNCSWLQSLFRTWSQKDSKPSREKRNKYRQLLFEAYSTTVWPLPAMATATHLCISTPRVGLMRPCLMRECGFKCIPETDGLLGKEKRKRPWSHSLGVTQTLVGRECYSATSGNTLNPKSVLYVASELETPCQSLEARKLELRALLSSRPHSSLALPGADPQRALGGGCGPLTALAAAAAAGRAVSLAALSSETVCPW